MPFIFIGTSGWSYEHWQRVFYPEYLTKTKWLEYYCQYFKTVELNTSFYHLPKRKTFEDWRARTGKDFVFSVKGSRYITHIKKLKDCQQPVKKFFERVEAIEDKDGKTVVLWQLPPRWKLNLERLRKFVNLLPARWRYAFEFREESWLSKEVFEILGKKGMAVVFQDFE